MPVSAERISARASMFGSNAHTTPGMLCARRESRAESMSAGVQRTEYEPLDSRALPLLRLR